MNQDQDIVGFAIYLAEQWNQLLESADDRNQLEDTWLEWNNDMIKFKMELQSKGIEVKDIIVDINELLAYCKKHKLKNNVATRSRYVSEKLYKMHIKR